MNRYEATEYKHCHIVLQGRPLIEGVLLLAALPSPPLLQPPPSKKHPLLTFTNSTVSPVSSRSTYPLTTIPPYCYYMLWIVLFLVSRLRTCNVSSSLPSPKLTLPLHQFFTSSFMFCWIHSFSFYLDLFSFFLSFKFNLPPFFLFTPVEPLIHPLHQLANRLAFIDQTSTWTLQWFRILCPLTFLKKFKHI